MTYRFRGARGSGEESSEIAPSESLAEQEPSTRGSEARSYQTRRDGGCSISEEVETESKSSCRKGES
eukprot:2327767-Amphidinium_carterae.1